MPEFQDSFEPRPFQEKAIQAFLDNHNAGIRLTVLRGSPGSGKTPAAMAIANQALREGFGDITLTLTPRVNLGKDMELKYRGEFIEKFDSRSRVSAFKFSQSPANVVFKSGQAVVLTYSLLVSGSFEEALEGFARRFGGRFVLICDEAQFLGSATEDGDALKAAQLVEWLHQHSAHTVLMTGTPYRSDKRELILCADRYSEPDGQGLRKLRADVDATYSDGLREEYLRQFEVLFVDADIVERDRITREASEYQLSERGDRLTVVLRRDDVWRPIVDKVVSAVRDKQRVHGEYRGLITCMEQSEAEAVRDYIRDHYPTMPVEIAISKDGADADEALKRFKKAKHAGILVTVRMAFIGYDCKPITVLGILTNYRDWGHLEQIVGRGLRVDELIPWGQQSCRIIAPDDPEMQKFVDYLRELQDHGLREHDKVPRDPGDGGEPPAESRYFVESATASTVRAVSNDGELDSGQLAFFEAMARECDLAGVDRNKLAKFYNLTRGVEPEPEQTAGNVQEGSDSSSEDDLTEDEQIAKLNSETKILINKILYLDGVDIKDPGYGDACKALTWEVNNRAGGNAGAARRSIAIARRRREVAEELHQESQA